MRCAFSVAPSIVAAMVLLESCLSVKFNPGWLAKLRGRVERVPELPVPSLILDDVRLPTQHLLGAHVTITEAFTNLGLHSALEQIGFADTIKALAATDHRISRLKETVALSKNQLKSSKCFPLVVASCDLHEYEQISDRYTHSQSLLMKCQRELRISLMKLQRERETLALVVGSRKFTSWLKHAEAHDKPIDMYQTLETHLGVPGAAVFINLLLSQGDETKKIGEKLQSAQFDAWYRLEIFSASQLDNHLTFAQSDVRIPHVTLQELFESHRLYPPIEENHRVKLPSVLCKDVVRSYMHYLKERPKNR